MFYRAVDGDGTIEETFRPVAVVLDGERRERRGDTGQAMIVYKTDAEIEAMGESADRGRDPGASSAAGQGPAIRTRDLDAYAERRTRELGAKPAFKGYRGYPASVCVSVNEEIIHGIPSARLLQDGRHRQPGFRRPLRGLLRRRGPDLPRRRGQRPGRPAHDGGRGLVPPGRRADGRGQPASRTSRPPSSVRRGPGVLGDPVVRRPRHRPGPPRGAQVPNFGSPAGARRSGAGMSWPSSR